MKRRCLRSRWLTSNLYRHGCRHMSRYKRRSNLVTLPHLIWTHDHDERDTASRCPPPSTNTQTPANSPLPRSSTTLYPRKSTTITNLCIHRPTIPSTHSMILLDSGLHIVRIHAPHPPLITQPSSLMRLLQPPIHTSLARSLLLATTLALSLRFCFTSQPKGTLLGYRSCNATTSVATVIVCL